MYWSREITALERDIPPTYTAELDLHLSFKRGSTYHPWSTATPVFIQFGDLIDSTSFYDATTAKATLIINKDLPDVLSYWTLTEEAVVL